MCSIKWKYNSIDSFWVWLTEWKFEICFSIFEFFLCFSNWKFFLRFRFFSLEKFLLWFSEEKNSGDIWRFCVNYWLTKECFVCFVILVLEIIWFVVILGKSKEKKTLGFGKQKIKKSKNLFGKEKKNRKGKNKK